MIRQLAQRVPSQLIRMCSSRALTGERKRLILPNNVVPKHYNLFIEPDLSKYTYNGKVGIDLEVRQPTNKITLNAFDLKFSKVSFNGMSSVNEEYDTDAQAVTWTFPNGLTDSGQLEVDFDGILNDQMSGFYRSLHKDANGNTQCVATTQMEPTDCRRAFPCFDEPAIKATFDISIAADSNLTVLSNSSVRETSTRNDGKVVTVFNTTPKMSTYLVAFIVGELRYVESDEFRVPVRVYATPGLEERCKFSASLAAKTLAFFEEKFGIEYPLPKCDMVGLHDFSAGAMENWGLITYRLVEIMYDETKDSLDTKQRVAEVVQHELAHQWFGNLVTMEWWEGLWLNEGFATWMSWFSSNHFFPEWRVWESYVTNVAKGCLALDGLRSSHPIEVPVSRADEVAQIFDAISYLKGSCVIRMISKYLGEDEFIRGIAHYLKKHAYGNTTTEDLWQALSESSGKEVKPLMEIWTKHQGYPVLTVKDDGTIEQHRYLETADVMPEEDGTLYPVFLGIRKLDGSVDSSRLLRGREVTLNEEFLKLNAEQTGIFRVKYSDAHLRVLASSDKLSVEDRVGLVSDLGALSGGYVSTTQLLTLVKQWYNDPSSTVWLAMDSEIRKISALLRYDSDGVRDLFKAFRSEVTLPKLQELGLKFDSGEPVQQSQLRARLFSSAVSVENPEIIETALQMFAQHEFEVNPNLRFSVFSAVSKFGTGDQWQKLFSHYLQGSNGASGNDALGSLGITEDPLKLQRILDSVLRTEIRSQDGMFALSGVVSHKQGQIMVWNWLQQNWDKLQEIYSVSSGLFARIVSYATGSFTKTEQLEEVNTFLATKDLRGISQAVKISTERIKSAILWREKEVRSIEKWLSRRGQL